MWTCHSFRWTHQSLIHFYSYLLNISIPALICIIILVFVYRQWRWYFKLDLNTKKVVIRNWMEILRTSFEGRIHLRLSRVSICEYWLVFQHKIMDILWSQKYSISLWTQQSLRRRFLKFHGHRLDSIWMQC